MNVVWEYKSFPGACYKHSTIIRKWPWLFCCLPSFAQIANNTYAYRLMLARAYSISDTTVSDAAAIANTLIAGPQHGAVLSVLLNELSDTTLANDSLALLALVGIANGCFEETGTAMFEARAILNHYGDYDFTETSCNPASRLSNTTNSNLQTEELRNGGQENKETLKQKFSIVPNPARNITTVTAVGLMNDETEIILYDQMGRALYMDKTMASEGIINKQIDLSGINTGIYIVKVLVNKIPVYAAKLEIIK